MRVEYDRRMMESVKLKQKRCKEMGALLDFAPRPT